MSLSNRPAQQQNTPSVEIRTVDSSATIDERTSSEDSDVSIDPIAKIRACAVDEVSTLHSVPQLVDGLDSLKVEQHRFQAEHLSRVLHNNLTLAKVVDLPESQCGYTRYGSLGTHTDTMQNLRSITAPVPPTYLPESTLEDLLAILDVTRATPLHASVSDQRLRSQSVVSLRDGGGGDRRRQIDKFMASRYSTTLELDDPAQALIRYDMRVYLKRNQRSISPRGTSPATVYTIANCQLIKHFDRG
jgi:DCN1-like protein 1/2